MRRITRPVGRSSHLRRLTSWRTRTLCTVEAGMPRRPARLAGRLCIPASTVHKVLVRHEVSRLKWLDRPTGRVIRRIETSRPGELLQIDVKKLAKIPDGGGHKMRGREVTHNRKGLGYTHVHSAVDAYSR